MPEMTSDRPSQYGDYILHTDPERREWGVNDTELDLLWNGGVSSVAREMFLAYLPLGLSCAINALLGFLTDGNLYVVGLNTLAALSFLSLAFYFHRVSARDQAARKSVYDKIKGKPPTKVNFSVKSFDPVEEGFALFPEGNR